MTSTGPTLAAPGVLTARREPAGTGPHGPAGRRPAHPGSAAGDPGRFAAAFAMLFCEVESGCRPRRQLAPLMSPLLVARLAPVWVRPGTPAKVVRVRGWSAAPGRYDAVAVLRRRQRYTALALQLVRGARGSWLVHDVLRPEEGALPDPRFPPPADEPDSFDLVGCGDATPRGRLAHPEPRG